MCIASHEQSEIKPCPEKVKNYSHVDWLFENKGDEEDQSHVELWQHFVGDHNIAADERHTCIKLSNVFLLEPIIEWVLLIVNCLITLLVKT